MNEKNKTQIIFSFKQEKERILGGPHRECRYASFYPASLYCTSQIPCFSQIEEFWQVCTEQVYRYHFSQQHLLTSCLCVTFG